MTTRICRTCRQRFVPALQDQSTCAACARDSRDIEIVDRYMRRAPGESIARVAIVTGIAEETIRQLAADGRLAVSPVDHMPPRRCTCPPGETGRCPACRARLARQFGEASRAVLREQERQSGMHARRRHA